MSYITLKDLRDRFGDVELIQLTDTHDNDAIDQVKVNQAIADADAMIDSYIGGRYGLPLVETPTVLVKPACDITRYYLYDDNTTELVENNYNTALKFLKDVQAGKATLGISESVENNHGVTFNNAAGKSSIDWETF